ncbi:MAG: ATP-binding cassette domain-containing protein [Bdellovibrionales bacterium]|nr:ATP-binding cassette domain-containing protein [Bdellovibrionales bacterium]
MIEVLNLCKQYGEHQAVKGVSFKVERGEILGFLGPNGAGKTTTMRMLTGVLPPSSGTAVLSGFDILESPLEVKRRIGYLPETPPLYTDLTVESYLGFVMKFKMVPKNLRKESLAWAIEKCGLQEVSKRLIANLSKGFRQRVGLAQAIINKPDVLILDEPTVGLDPKQIREIRAMIQELANDHTIILSTHILPEVTMVCNRATIINRGKVVTEGSIEELTAERSLEEVFIDIITKDEQ